MLFCRCELFCRHRNRTCWCGYRWENVHLVGTSPRRHPAGICLTTGHGGVSLASLWRQTIASLGIPFDKRLCIHRSDCLASLCALGSRASRAELCAAAGYDGTGGPRNSVSLSTVPCTLRPTLSSPALLDIALLIRTALHIPILGSEPMRVAPAFRSFSRHTRHCAGLECSASRALSSRPSSILGPDSRFGASSPPWRARLCICILPRCRRQVTENFQQSRLIVAIRLVDRAYKRLI